MTAELRRYPQGVSDVQLNLLGSHDTPRALTVLRGDEVALRLAVQLQFTLPGAPCIYYGDEVGLDGGHDPASRQGMPWSREGWNRELFEHHRRLIALRHEHAALRTGAFEVLEAAGGLFAYRRHDDDGDLIGVINTSPGARRLTLPTVSGAEAYHDLLGSLTVGVSAEGPVVEVPGRSGGLLQPSER